MSERVEGGGVDSFGDAVAAVRAGGDPIEAATTLYALLSDDERLGLLDGDTPFWEGVTQLASARYNARPYIHGEVPRLGIPGTRFVDGPRGCVAGEGTAFPVSMARGATWDVDLEEQVGEAIGREIRAQGGNFFGGVCINLLRHPAWGRAQETYGDDPYHLGELGAALTRGAQRFVMACAKHYALNSMENARFTVDVTVDERTLHDVYLPHFKRTVDEGVAAVMASYNSVNGEWAGQNHQLLTGVLRNAWGFEGITVTDFIWGMRDGAAALEAGMDLEEPFAQQRATHLRAQIEAGETSWDAVERSAVRLLAAQVRSYASREDDAFGPDTMAAPDHRALARAVAARGMVLLKNDPVDGATVLPIVDSPSSIAVIGRLATEANLGDRGSSNVLPPAHVPPVDGLRAGFPDALITLVTDDDPAAAAGAAAAADLAVVVVGFTATDEGEYLSPETNTRPELFALFPPMPADLDLAALLGSGESGLAATGGDRSSLTLRTVDEAIILAVAEANPRTVVALVAGSAVVTESWRASVPAVLVMWYAGMEGGHALADVLTGRQDPAGRLPFAVPTSPEHLPSFDRDATTITYDRFHGQRLLDRLGVEPAFPHGFGLSYTTFAIEDAVVVDRNADSVHLDVTVRNTGARDGRHVVQVYGRRRTGGYAGELLLAGFAPVAVPAGGSAVVAVDVSMLPLAEWDPDARRRVTPEPDDVTLEVGGHAHDPSAVHLDLGRP
jgi:beta-glucosidase